MATARVRIVILTVCITLSVYLFNRMAHTTNNQQKIQEFYYEQRLEKQSSGRVDYIDCIANSILRRIAVEDSSWLAFDSAM
jgi:hypothetical protein